jgi:hypothetical protein
VTPLVLGAIGAWILFVVLLRLRLSACIPAHPARSDSRAVEPDLAERRRSGSPRAPAIFLRSSAGPGLESLAESKVTVNSPLHGPREIDLSLFARAATGIERPQDHDPAAPGTVQSEIIAPDSPRPSHGFVRWNI